MRILYHGSATGNSGSRYRGLGRLGHTTKLAFATDPISEAWWWLRAIEWRLCDGPTTWTSNRRFLRTGRAFSPELVWVEMGKLVYPSVLKQLKNELGCLLINTYSDDFLEPLHKSRHHIKALELYDCVFTPRDVNVPEMRKRGAKRVLKFWKGFDPELHYPERLSAEDMKVFGTDVVFVGHAEPSRIRPFAVLAEKVQSMRIWGPTWNRFSLPVSLERVVAHDHAEGERYRKAICGAKIALHMLSRENRDTQSSRTFEIPACGTLMMAERTDDHLECFEEDKEAVFYSNTEEMCDKTVYYLQHEAARERIARAGYERSQRAGYSNYERVAAMLDAVLHQ